MNKSKKFLLLASGVFVNFFFFGILQEKITKAQYVRADGSIEYYTYSMSSVFIYCTVNYLLMKAVSVVTLEEDTTPNIYYSFLSLFYFLAMMCSNLALQFINYPTQVVAKSCKPIPVMIFGVLFGRKSYSFKKYIFVGLVVIGGILFMYKEVKEENKNLDGFGIGEFLILSSLFMDGMTAAMQERIRADYQVKAMSLMIGMNKWAAIYVGILWVLTKESFKFIAFLQREPSVIWKLCGLSVFGFLGQFAMISTVSEFGALAASMVATLRKFFTVVTSALLLGSSLTPRQWLGAVIIFSGLFLDIMNEKLNPKIK